ncbi:MAG: ribonucleoside-diphosphate reductase, adenosylcobalamin-dependent, partial [Kiloniellaceae bacterium]
PRGGAWLGGRYVPSLLAAIGAIIERHMIDTGFLQPPGEAERAAEQPAMVANLPGAGGLPAGIRQCPKCGGAAVIRQEGCDLCTSCGYSKCV